MKRCLFSLVALALVLCAGCGDSTIQAVEKSMAIDGSFSDWEGVSAAATDPTGDVAGLSSAADFTAIYVSVDENNIYFRVDVAGEIGAQSIWVGIGFSSDAQPEGHNRSVFCEINKDNDGVTSTTAGIYIPWGPEGGEHTPLSLGQIAVSGNMVEMAFARSDLGLSGTWNLNINIGIAMSNNQDRSDDQPWVNFDQ